MHQQSYIPSKCDSSRLYIFYIYFSQVQITGEDAVTYINGIIIALQIDILTPSQSCEGALLSD